MHCVYIIRVYIFLKAGTHEATNRSNMLLQQIALCVQSSDKSFALIAVIGCSDKSPGVNASTFGDSLRAGTHEAINRSNMLLQQIALCVQSSEKSYALIAAIGCSDKSPGANASTFGDRLI